MLKARSKSGQRARERCGGSETKLDGLIKRVDYLVAEFMRSFWQASPQSK